MSLINEALKKAQRQRHDETGETATATALPVVETTTAPAGDAASFRRGKTSGSNALLLFGSGAVVLVVLSVVVTVVLLNRSPAPVAPVAAVAAVAAARPAPTAPAASTAKTTVELPPPPLTPPVITPPAVTAPAPAVPAAVEPAATVAAQAAPAQPVATAAPAPAATPSPAPAASAPAVSTSALPALETAPIPATPAPVAGPAKPDERIARFVEAIKVTGIRSSGAESRVLMNDRVYRVNDTVERTLGVKLVKVEADQLTFTDANGLTYVKSI